MWCPEGGSCHGHFAKTSRMVAHQHRLPTDRYKLVVIIYTFKITSFLIPPRFVALCLIPCALSVNWGFNQVYIQIFPVSVYLPFWGAHTLNLVAFYQHFDILQISHCSRTIKHESCNLARYLWFFLLYFLFSHLLWTKHMSFKSKESDYLLGNLVLTTELKT